eukprot:Skav216794  [mRNA]  locus=scaffold1384:239756:240850:+ [translate_table: standard]
MFCQSLGIFRAPCYRFISHVRPPRLSTQQIKKAKGLLEKSRGLLQKYQCQIVQVPDSGLLVILLGVSHIEIASVKAVQEIIQSTDPDAICVELCLQRVLARMRIWLATKDVNGNVMLPETQLLDMFRQRTIHLPWQLREEVLKSAEALSQMGRVEKMVPLDCLYEVRSEVRIQSVMSVGMARPMPPELEELLGPESDYDVFTRVIGFERDVILAREIRSIHGKSVEYAPHGPNGPLVLAVIGKAHLDGVAHQLKLPLSQLDETIAGF